MSTLWKLPEPITDTESEELARMFNRHGAGVMFAAFLGAFTVDVESNDDPVQCMASESVIVLLKGMSEFVSGGIIQLHNEREMHRLFEQLNRAA